MNEHQHRYRSTWKIESGEDLHEKELKYYFERKYVEGFLF